jgi:hypothetical protein
MKRTVTYGSERTGDYLIVAIKKSRSMFHLKDDTIVAWRLLAQIKHTNKRMGAQGRLSPPFPFVKSTPSKAKEFASGMAFK